jgi:hypothetical protein
MWKFAVATVEQSLRTVATLLFFAAVAQAGTAPETCKSQNSEFLANGATARGLIFGPVGSHIHLYQQHPALCISASAGACEGKSYLVPGDGVDVVTACGDYVRVRYVGKNHVSIGWINKTSLSESHSPEVPRDLLSEIEGYYSSGGHCWAKNADGSVEPCGFGADEDSCLLFKKIRPCS